MQHIDYDIKSVDTFMLASLAPHSLLFPCKEGALRVNIKVSMHITMLKNMLRRGSLTICQNIFANRFLKSVKGDF